MKKTVKEIADHLYRSFSERVSDVQHFDSSPLPDKDEVYSMIEDLKTLLFPGYFGHSSLSFETIDVQMGFKVARIYEFLKTQVFLEALHVCKSPGRPCDNCQEYSEFLTQGFLEELPGIRAALDLDVKAAYKNDPAASGFDEIIFSYPGLEAIAIYRLANHLYRAGLILIPRIMSEWAHSRTGIDIHPGATIGKSFFIDHGTGVVIGETSVIGDGVTLYQGVTLGALNFPRDAEGMVIRRDRRHPQIEDDVVIYAGATILGGKTVIGHNSVIGGNVWLTESVPPFSKVQIAKSDLEILSINRKEI